MNVRIQSDLASVSSAAPAPISNGSTNKAGSRYVSTGNQVDNVNLSAGVQAFENAALDAGASRRVRVDALQALFQAGRYQVDSRQIAAALVTSAIGASSDLT
jgi:anti-sigma28 factor (negative regulator of flagellin synthesis)